MLDFKLGRNYKWILWTLFYLLFGDNQYLFLFGHITRIGLFIFWWFSGQGLNPGCHGESTPPQPSHYTTRGPLELEFLSYRVYKCLFLLDTAKECLISNIFVPVHIPRKCENSGCTRCLSTLDTVCLFVVLLPLSLWKCMLYLVSLYTISHLYGLETDELTKSRKIF